MKTIKSFLALFLCLSLAAQSVQASRFSKTASKPFTLSLPSSLGYISETHSTSSRKPDFILIQDLHVNRSVQFAISRILKHLQQQGLMPDRIAVEGETGPVDLGGMQTYPDPTIRKEAADYLVEQGEMPGAMHFAVTEGHAGLFGIENDAYYHANLEMFRRSYADRQNLRQEIEKLQAVLPRLRKDKAVRENVAILEKDIQAISQLINNQVIPEELPELLARATTAAEHLKQVLGRHPGEGRGPGLDSGFRRNDDLVESLSASINFYALALLRDQEFFKNALAVRQLGQQKTTIVVTGGFHTDAFARHLKQQGFSYAVITPNVKRHDKTDERLYVERLLGHHLTLEQASTGQDGTMQMLAALNKARTLFPAIALYLFTLKQRTWGNRAISFGKAAVPAALCGVLHVACGGGASPTTPTPTPNPNPNPNPNLPVGVAFSDEFDGPANTSPDGSKWTYDLGGGGWGNQELQTYTNSPANVRLNGQGQLVIRVERTPNGGYTSARIKTQGLQMPQYGHIEARIKIPAGNGLWPAFWMLGEDFNGSNWPQVGEIDIMENIGRQPSTVYSAVHGPGYSGGGGLARTYSIGGNFSDAFHTFAVDWNTQLISFSVDGQVYHTVTPASLPGGASWVFNKKFFVLLNIAVGGNFPGAPDASTAFPQEMVVDYVRYTPQPPTLLPLQEGAPNPYPSQRGLMPDRSRTASSGFVAGLWDFFLPGLQASGSRPGTRVAVPASRPTFFQSTDHVAEIQRRARVLESVKADAAKGVLGTRRERLVGAAYKDLIDAIVAAVKVDPNIMKELAANGLVLPALPEIASYQQNQPSILEEQSRRVDVQFSEIPSDEEGPRRILASAPTLKLTGATGIRFLLSASIANQPVTARLVLPGAKSNPVTVIADDRAQVVFPLVAFMNGDAERQIPDSPTLWVGASHFTGPEVLSAHQVLLETAATPLGMEVVYPRNVHMPSEPKRTSRLRASGWERFWQFFSPELQAQSLRERINLQFKAMPGEVNPDGTITVAAMARGPNGSTFKLSKFEKLHFQFPGALANKPIRLWLNIKPVQGKRGVFPPTEVVEVMVNPDGSVEVPFTDLPSEGKSLTARDLDNVIAIGAEISPLSKSQIESITVEGFLTLPATPKQGIILWGAFLMATLLGLARRAGSLIGRAAKASLPFVLLLVLGGNGEAQTRIQQTPLKSALIEVFPEIELGAPDEQFDYISREHIINKFLLQQYNVQDIFYRVLPQLGGYPLTRFSWVIKIPAKDITQIKEVYFRAEKNPDGSWQIIPPDTDPMAVTVAQNARVRSVPSETVGAPDGIEFTLPVSTLENLGDILYGEVRVNKPEDPTSTYPQFRFGGHSSDPVAQAAEPLVVPFEKSAEKIVSYRDKQGKARTRVDHRIYEVQLTPELLESPALDASWTSEEEPKMFEIHIITPDGVDQGLAHSIAGGSAHWAPAFALKESDSGPRRTDTGILVQRLNRLQQSGREGRFTLHTQVRGGGTNIRVPAGTFLRIKTNVVLKGQIKSHPPVSTPSVSVDATPSEKERPSFLDPQGSILFSPMNVIAGLSLSVILIPTLGPIVTAAIVGGILLVLIHALLLAAVIALGFDLWSTRIRRMPNQRRWAAFAAALIGGLWILGLNAYRSKSQPVEPQAITYRLEKLAFQQRTPLPPHMGTLTGQLSTVRSNLVSSTLIDREFMQAGSPTHITTFITPEDLLQFDHFILQLYRPGREIDEISVYFKRVEGQWVAELQGESTSRKRDILKKINAIEKNNRIELSFDPETLPHADIVQGITSSVQTPFTTLTVSENRSIQRREAGLITLPRMMLALLLPFFLAAPLSAMSVLQQADPATSLVTLAVVALFGFLGGRVELRARAKALRAQLASVNFRRPLETASEYFAIPYRIFSDRIAEMALQDQLKKMREAAARARQLAIAA